jgi:hypothetical protein
VRPQPQRGRVQSHRLDTAMFFSNVYSFPCIWRSVVGSPPCIHLCNLPRLYSLTLDAVHLLGHWVLWVCRHFHSRIRTGSDKETNRHNKVYRTNLKRFWYGEYLLLVKEPKGSTPLIKNPNIGHDPEPVLSTSSLLTTFFPKISLTNWTFW